MKKTYGKPIVSFESFAFSSNIAGACASVVGLHSQNASCAAYGTMTSPEFGTCKFVNDYVEIFGQGICEVTPENSSFDLCYHNPSDSTKMFMS